MRVFPGDSHGEHSFMNGVHGLTSVSGNFPRYLSTNVLSRTHRMVQRGNIILLEHILHQALERSSPYLTDEETFRTEGTFSREHSRNNVKLCCSAEGTSSTDPEPPPLVPPVWSPPQSTWQVCGGREGGGVASEDVFCSISGASLCCSTTGSSGSQEEIKMAVLLRPAMASCTTLNNHTRSARRF